MPYKLDQGIGFLCEQVESYIAQPSFIEVLDAVDSVVRDNKLYWNLQEGQGYAVIDPVAQKVYRVFEVTEALSDNHLSDGALAILVSISIDNFVSAVNHNDDKFINHTKGLVRAVPTLINSVTKLFQLKIDAEDLASTGCQILGGKLYWNLQEGQGYAVIDPVAQKVYRVFEVTEPLSENHLCDNALVRLIDLDIHRFVGQLAELSRMKLVLVSIAREMIDDEDNGFPPFLRKKNDYLN